jgi:hypothetical protein
LACVGTANALQVRHRRAAATAHSKPIALQRVVSWRQGATIEISASLRCSCYEMFLSGHPGTDSVGNAGQLMFNF